MFCTTAQLPTDAVRPADTVEIARRAERIAEAELQDGGHQRGVVARHALHEAQLTELDRCSNRARSKALKAAIASAREVKISQHLLADRESAADKRHTELGRTGGDPAEVAKAAEAYAKLNHEWMAEWDVLRERADDILTAPIQHPDDLNVRHDAYLCLLGDRVDPLGTCDENTELEALKSIRVGLIQLRAAACPVADIAEVYREAVIEYDRIDADDLGPAGKVAWSRVDAAKRFGLAARADSFAGLAFRLCLIADLAGEIEDTDLDEAASQRIAERLRDIAINAFELLDLPVDEKTATDFFGAENLTGVF